MRLSEAIREGCKYGPQAFNGLGRRGIGLCALGAAFEAIEWQSSEETFPILEHMTACPCSHKQPAEFSMFNRIVHLNDDHRWTREAISEWVETIERKLGLWGEQETSIPATKSNREFANTRT